MCGTDRTLQSSGILPNDEGHARLAEAIIDAIRDDQGEPIDQPITPTRTYSSGLNDWASRQVEATRRREAEKREANRPTGTELGGVTQKLDELTQAQGVQQVLLEQQQDELQRQQEQLKRQQDELQKQQGRLDEQQKALKAAQDQLKRQQETLDKQQKALKGVVDEQGGQVNTLKTLTKNLQKTDEKIDTIQHTLWENQQKLDNRIDKLDERVQKLENGTSA